MNCEDFNFLTQVNSGEVFWYKYVYSGDLSILCISCCIGLGGEVVLLPSVSFLVSVSFTSLKTETHQCVWALLVLGIFSKTHEAKPLLD